VASSSLVRGVGVNRCGTEEFHVLGSHARCRLGGLQVQVSVRGLLFSGGGWILCRVTLRFCSSTYTEEEAEGREEAPARPQLESDWVKAGALAVVPL
jgi:hypothetical protein